MSSHIGGRQQCRYVSNGRGCPYGDRCRFSHNLQTSPPSASNGPPRNNATRGNTRGLRNAGSPRNHGTPRSNGNDSSRNELNSWLYSLRNFGSGYARNNATFFEMALHLVGRDTAAKETVISQLASDEGLQRIARLHRETDTCASSERFLFFRQQMVPFFEILSHKEVVSCLILEQSTTAIFNFLFGPSGTRAICLFQFAATVLTEVLSSADIEAPLKATGLEATLAVFSKIVDLNSTAIVIEELPKVLDEIVQVVDALASQDLEYMVRSSRPHVKRMRKQFGIGSSIPEPKAGPSRQGPRPVFNVETDGPGELSPRGPRHDNDFKDIENIRILPTDSEIRSQRGEYLPSNDGIPHHHTGAKNLVDRHFRLLREDTVGPLRDAVRIELGKVESSSNVNGITGTSQQAARTFVHRMAVLHRVHSHKFRGLELVYGIPQPSQLQGCLPAQRRSMWEVSKRLQVGALVCVLSHDGRATFCSVSHNGLRENKEKENENTEDDPMPPWANLFDSEGAAFVALSLINPDDSILGPLLDEFGTGKMALPASLIEFPGVLLASFESTLKALQTMSKSDELPFSEILAPINSSSTEEMVVHPPEYMLRPGFKMELKCLSTDSASLSHSASQRLSPRLLQQHSSLDETQAKAVIDSFNREIALIQGPPGTGKSYTGVAIIRALLANEKKGSLGPVVCVCYTNHALDQLLEQLVDSGVDNIARIGSQSKSETLKNLNLREISRKIDQTGFERGQRRGAIDKLNERTKELNRQLSKFMLADTASDLEEYLREFQQVHHEELFERPPVDEEGWETVSRHRQSPVEAWLSRGESREDVTPRPIDELQETTLESMTKEERNSLLSFWIKDSRDRVRYGVRLGLNAYVQTRNTLDTCRTEIDLRSLKQASVIGVTTTGLARVLKLLQTLGPKVVVCEEAGEVLEAHSLATLLPTIQHAILIGDHLQLKPQIQNFDLSSENPAGKRFSLDRSLFERLIKTASLPLSTLQTQRRMHPSISSLIRSTLYPNLEDHGGVKSYPEVEGLRRRLFWLNHEQEEQKPHEGNMVSTSHVNPSEVRMVEAVTSHLLKQGQYGSNEIAVITPYLGQLRALRDALGRSMTIQLEERDQVDMEAQGLEVEMPGDRWSQVKRTSIGNAVRVATVDNFQGEEANFVIVSLVRSNQYRKCGFLKTSNRINVLLSRAKHGMLVIGNEDTASSAPMWRNVLQLFKAVGSFGNDLELACPRHPETSITVRTPDDFLVSSPEGGCKEPCRDRLSCGHPCDKKCHSEHLHKAVQCLNRCQRSVPGCDVHECPEFCGDKCPKQCSVKIRGVSLPCGHVRDLPCWEAKDPESAKCRAIVDWISEACGHTIKIQCFKRHTPDEIICSSECGKPLPCGHTCKRPCKSCLKKENGEITQDHGKCQQICGRKYSTCSHTCKAECHGEEPCQLCQSDCQVSCVHSKCSKECCKPCSPCAVELCTSRCPHSQCDLPCSVPCSWLPCSRRCENILECGHQCPSACGEVCPTKKYCQECCNEEIKKVVVDYIEFREYQEVDLATDPCLFLDCGHIQTRSSLDGIFSLDKHYEFNEKGEVTSIKKDSKPFSSENDMKTCPECRGSLRGVSRYGRLVKRAILDESTKRLITWAHQNYTNLADSLKLEEDNLQKSGNERISILPSFAFSGPADRQFHAMRTMPGFKNEHKKAMELRVKIARFKHEVRKEEQPYQRVFELVESARRRKGVDARDVPDDVKTVQMRHYLLASNLLLRCDLALLNAALEWRNGAVGLHGMDSSNTEKFVFDLSTNRSNCEEVIAEAESATQPAIQTEAHILYGLYAALEKSTISDSTTQASKQKVGTSHEQTRVPNDSDLSEMGLGQIEAAKKVQVRFPGQTKAYTEEIVEVEKMLRASTFQSPFSAKERYEVMKAMAAEFRGTGHWYHCGNGHPFTIGECGMPMEHAICPQCGEAIGGMNHETAEGVERHDDWEREFENLRL